MIPRFEKNIFVQYAKGRIKANKNFLVVVTGETGSGKSWAAISLAKMINPDFSEEHIVLSYLDLIEIAESRKFPKGTVLVFDEVSAEALQARDAMSKKNKNVSAILQTFRNLNYVVFFTTPDISFVDSQARRLMHMVLVTRHINTKAERCKLQMYFIRINRIKGSMYYQIPRVKINDEYFRCSYLSVPKPPDELIQVYEKKKWFFQKRLYKKLKKEFAEEV